MIEVQGVAIIKKTKEACKASKYLSESNGEVTHWDVAYRDGTTITYSTETFDALFNFQTGDDIVASIIGKKTVEDLPPLAQEDILEEAIRITSTDRRQDYGHPYENFANIAAMGKIIFGVDITPQQVALFFVATKICRQINSPKRDNWVDMAGYARCGALCDEREGK